MEYQYAILLNKTSVTLRTSNERITIDLNHNKSTSYLFLHTLIFHMCYIKHLNSPMELKGDNRNTVFHKVMRLAYLMSVLRNSYMIYLTTDPNFLKPGPAH